MIIKRKNRLINFRNTWAILKCNNIKIRIFSTEDDYMTLEFSSMEERDKSFEKIIEAYRWDRKVCDLD